VNISETLVSVSPVTKAAEDMYRFSDTISKNTEINTFSREASDTGEIT
jgi:hypothetical protein